MKRDLTERIDKLLTGSNTVHATAGAMQKITNALFLHSPLRPLKTFLNGTWFQHPLHPVLTDIAVGGWTAAILLDLIALIFGVKSLGLASGIVNGLGVLGALGAIVTGLT